jgi:formylglycine-generating enzyme required for sulfatase activity
MAFLSAFVVSSLGGCHWERLDDPRFAEFMMSHCQDFREEVSFWQEVPGAAYKIRMVAVIGDSDRKIAPFWISQVEIPWEAFDVFVYRLDETSGELKQADAVTRPSKPYLPPDRGFGHEGFPAISMSYQCATAFCQWLSERSGKNYRLPTEKEWELACRAILSFEEESALFKNDYGIDNYESALKDYAWFVDNADGAPHAVGTRKPNRWGLHDMHGNVQEWCIDADGQPITKGGSYRDSAEKLKVSARALPEPSWNGSDPQIPKSKWWLADAPFVGFRIVCEVPEEAAATAPATQPALEN